MPVTPITPSVVSQPNRERDGAGADLPPSQSAPADDHRMVAALYVQTDGCYYGQTGVDPWDVHRDARTYAGPYPVVAHPPCQRWGAFAAINYARWGGEHNRPGNDGGCFAAALAAVRAYGGVLEHPAKSKAWAAFRLHRPSVGGWQLSDDGGWTCEVWQSAYGHQANKATWLYAYGVRPIGLRWSRPIGSHQVGYHDQRGPDRNKPTLSKVAAAATPPQFRDLLLSIARTANPPADVIVAAHGGCDAA